MARSTTCSPPGIRPCLPTMSNPSHRLPQPELPHGYWCSPLGAGRIFPLPIKPRIISATSPPVRDAAAGGNDMLCSPV
jgi:hypothetical protein